ncbi:MAG: DUF72 domain-containing protein [Deltaproteobacteria bacterium]|nr:DUF72 domain-containing protein [Deltaproteobacteria bacterium]
MEIQKTFYHPPRPDTLRRWRAEAPSNAVFVLKAWQLVTHPATSPTYRRVHRPVPEDRRDRYGWFRHTDEVWEGWEVTREAATILEAQAVLFQCPASFRPTTENVENLRRFFRRVGPQPFRLAWEPRGAWPRELVSELCSELGLLHAVDPLTTQPTTPSPIYFRLHGRGGYRHQYTDGELDHLADICRRRSGFVFFNNAHMWEDALRFQKRVSPKR